MAMQLYVDLYHCDNHILNNMEAIKTIARKAIADIPAQIVEECCHQFEPIGVTYIAVITTSHFSIHTWPEYGYAAVDIFSCAQEVPGFLARQLQEAFGAKSFHVNEFERNIEGGGAAWNLQSDKTCM